MMDFAGLYSDHSKWKKVNWQQFNSQIKIQI